MNKRGQIYILAVILLSIVVYSLSSVVNLSKQEEIKEDFKSLSRNYEIESARLINSVIQEDGNVSEAFEKFTILFTAYSKSKSPNFHIFYALNSEDSLHLGNFLDEPIYVYNICPGEPGLLNETVVSGCLGNISAQMSFEGFNIAPETMTHAEFEDLRKNCFTTLSTEGVSDKCIGVGGVLYGLPLEQNTPEIFSISRLKSGEQTLISSQGNIDEEKMCQELTTQSDCEDYSATCCWDGTTCNEGRCEPPPGSECGDKTCDAGEDCYNCPEDCVCCSDGTADKKCSATKPEYCDNGNLINKCSTCGCPEDATECKDDGHCEVLITCPNSDCSAGENCPADAGDCDDNLCYEPTCADGCGQTPVANGGTDEACYGSTGCSGNNCVCDGSGNCVMVQLKKFQCRSQYWTSWGGCDDGPPGCLTGYTCVDTDSDSCKLFWEKEKCLCRKDYWTTCSVSPSCGSDTKLGEEAC